MLTPLKYMAHVLIVLSISIVQAQPSSNSSILCYVSADYASHDVNADLVHAKPYTINCTYSDVNASIPKFIQFSCSGSTTLLTVKVVITDGTHSQTIAKDIQIHERSSLYEMPLLAFVSDKIIQSGNAKINSIEFFNNLDTKVMLANINFSNLTSKYEIKLNQVFTVDMSNALQKNYVIKSNGPREVSINLYKTNGEFSKRINKSLEAGENHIQFEEMKISDGKFVIAITENNNAKTIPNTNLSVMN